MLLKYSIAYVRGEYGLEKQIMRYPQLFATKSIEKTIGAGIKKGIIWHTQGSGKTALAFYNVAYLTDYFQKKEVIPKFYFIVDRIDLLNQAKREFTSRGLIVHTVNSKDELVRDFKLNTAIHNLSGQKEITVVNIQKFADDTEALNSNDYDITIQRIYFLDEVHRSYNPKGSFLVNLVTSDHNAIVIGLTGTPLISTDRNSRDVFGNYIHKYYYNASIADGYTLKLIREGIETNYQFQLVKILKEVEILKGTADNRIIFAHEKFVLPMLNYIVDDFVNSRVRFGDNTIGGMVVCESSDQAKKLFELFNTNHAIGNSGLSAALILHDIGTKDERKQLIEGFKNGEIDLLFVYNMLLTGFDAKRLKKLYIGRLIKDHNLLQMLTRVNRPYNNFKYGFVVDFADIRKEFDTTNRAYFDELQLELGNEIKNYSNLFKSPDEIESEIKDISEKLFHYDLKNAEIFVQQINQIQDVKQVLEIKKILENAKNIFNLIRLNRHYELLERIDFKKLTQLYHETANHLELLNFQNSIQNDVDSINLLNIALENVKFTFYKNSEEELVIADQLKDMLRKTLESLNSNFDHNDPEFKSLYDELKRMFDKKQLNEITQDEMKQNIGFLQQIFDKASELNRKNNLLKAKYHNDAKYARIHKRIMKSGNIRESESQISEVMLAIKAQADDKLLIQNRLLNNEPYFDVLMMGLVTNSFDKTKIKLEPNAAKYINACLVNEYINEYKGIQAS